MSHKPGSEKNEWGPEARRRFGAGARACDHGIVLNLGPPLAVEVGRFVGNYCGVGGKIVSSVDTICSIQSSSNSS